MEIYCLRVRREQAGKLFAFDRVYFAKNGEHTVFKKLFRYALIMPVEPQLKSILSESVTIDRSTTHTFDRVEEPEVLKHEDFVELLEANDWVMCVPILAKYVKENLPRYISAAGKYQFNTGRRKRITRNKNILDPFPALTYLQTPEQNIRPVCVACPKFIMHQNGHCRLGDKVCYESLALGVKNHFQEGMDAPPPSTNILEGD